MHELMPMVKQLGVPTFFLTLSCVDLRWNDIFYVISKANSIDISEDEINGMSYSDRCKLLNGNPVLVARHFQYRVELFFKVIVLDGPLGNTNYYAMRVEFQVRGSPHVHSFIWILSVRQLTSDNKPLYIEWLDGIIQTDLPDADKEPELFDLVKNYQMHRHSKTCQKFKNKSCRFNYRRYFTDHTIIAEPLPYNVAADVKMGTEKM